jgi:hypothetical protein
MSIVNFPETPALQSDGSRRQARSGTTVLRRCPWHEPSKIGTALDVAWTLLVLALIGAGIVMLRFLLVLARGAFGH